MVIVTTTVRLKPGKLSDCLKLFAEKVPALLRDQPDWVGSTMTVDRESNTITVFASWRREESYSRLADSKAYAATMGCFSPIFEERPDVRINEVLFSRGRSVIS